MDPFENPFTPGAGTPPPEMAGRHEAFDKALIALGRQRRGHPAQGVILIGLRGVGKTVLLNEIKFSAEEDGIGVVAMEAGEGRLPELVAEQLRHVLLRLSRREQARDLAQRAMRALSGFAGAWKVKVQDVEVQFDISPEPGLADYGVLDIDLLDLLTTAGEAARSADTCIALLIDELQYLDRKEMSSLIGVLHRATQRRLPVTLIGAGLPQVRADLGQAKSYAERMFEIVQIGALSPEEAGDAVAKPAAAQGVEVEAGALDEIVRRTGGYPYFVQQWAKHAWDAAEPPRITAADVETASEPAISALDEAFFRIRLDRVAAGEREYLRAMAELGSEPSRSKDVAAVLGRTVSQVAARRSRLIKKGMIWSPSYGTTAFTVPMFDDFMKRMMPDFEPATG